MVEIQAAFLSGAHVHVLLQLFFSPLQTRSKSRRQNLGFVRTDCNGQTWEMGIIHGCGGKQGANGSTSINSKASSDLTAEYS